MNRRLKSWCNKYASVLTRMASAQRARTNASLMPLASTPGLKAGGTSRIKVVGISEAGFEQAIAQVLRTHATDLDITSIQVRESRAGKYLSIGARITAQVVRRAAGSMRCIWS